MNKLMGFWELKNSLLPVVKWVEYNGQELEPNILWTVRSAVFNGDDLSLPRKVGVSAREAMICASKIKEQLGNNGLVIVYPYFVAEKSGTLKVELNNVVIETVVGDLWNFVTDGQKNASIIIRDNGEKDIIGDASFLSELELEDIIKWVPKIRGMFRDELYSGKSALLEWSIAYDSDLNGNKVGERYLVFYEARTIF